MDNCSEAVQSKGKDSRPKDPDSARAAFRAQAKSTIPKHNLRRLASNEGDGLHDEIDSGLDLNQQSQSTQLLPCLTFLRMVSVAMMPSKQQSKTSSLLVAHKRARKGRTML
jgi:hypothetical protein